jgi:DTW domain-containing protein YfiP
MIYLLTHARELQKRSNTGQLALNAFPDRVKRVIWERTSPNPELLSIIEHANVALVYPSSESEPSSALIECEHFVILDATWQEARKMVNRSPYLHSLPKVTLLPKSSSVFTIRRNQLEGGLCTAEAVACLFEQQACVLEANHLRNELQSFVDSYHRGAN